MFWCQTSLARDSPLSCWLHENLELPAQWKYRPRGRQAWVEHSSVVETYRYKLTFSQMHMKFLQSCKTQNLISCKPFWLSCTTRNSIAPNLKCCIGLHISNSDSGMTCVHTAETHLPSSFWMVILARAKGDKCTPIPPVRYNSNCSSASMLWSLWIVTVIFFWVSPGWNSKICVNGS